MSDGMEASGATLPRTGDFEPVGSVPALRRDERTEATEAPAHGVFPHLVKGDDDIVGLVAYSIYKQHKLDWLRAFQAAQGRPPDEAELFSYIVGEGTPRRLATYRHLADATLSGRGPHAGQEPIMTPGAARRSTFAERSGLTPGQIAIYAVIAAVFVIGVVLALRFTAMPQH